MDVIFNCIIWFMISFALIGLIFVAVSVFIYEDRAYSISDVVGLAFVTGVIIFIRYVIVKIRRFVRGVVN